MDKRKKSKIQQIFEIISLYGMSIILVAGSIYLEMSGNGLSPFYYVLGIGVVALLIAGGTKGVMDYRKSNLPSGERNLIDQQQHYNKIDKRRKQYRNLTRKHDSMMKEFFWNMLEYHFQINLILFILGILLIGLFWTRYEFLPTYLLGVAIGILAIVLIVHWIYIATGSSVKQFKKMIVSSDFDFKEVDSDYMHGTICVALSGYLCIGQQYSIYCAFKEESFIIPQQNIIGIEKRAVTEKIEGMGGTVERFYIRIYTNNYWREFPTDDIGADLILEEYKKLGVDTRIIDAR